MNILGISCYYHDAAAALLIDGKVVALAQEERFSRKKHDPDFPKQAINFCLKQANIKATALDYIVFYEKPFRKFHRILISAISTFPGSYPSFREAMRIWLSQKLWIKQEISSELNIDENKILFSDHHLSHAASSFFTSPFKKAAILTVDGVGEWTTASFGIGENNNIKILKEIHYPQSLGLLYSAFTAFLGYRVNSGEWKVMGLAPYGKPKYKDKVWKVVRKLKDGSFELDMSFFSFHYSDKHSFTSKFVDLFGKPINPKDSHQVTEKSADIAASIQSVIEELLISMAKNLQEKTKQDYLCLSGGVALNSVANYKILQKCGFKNIFIQPACGDSGAALGAAFYVNKCLRSNTTKKPKSYSKNVFSHAYFGQSWKNKDIEKFLKKKRVKYQKFSTKKTIDYIIGHILKGKVVGFMQDRFEWGPRALGARSILADPRNPKMKDIINAKVKFREAFRPFAPSVLAEHAHKVFDLPPTTHNLQPNDHFPLRYMLYVVPVKKKWQKKIPAITHVNGTTRPQLVYQKESPYYYNLILAFYKQTGVPLLLNTSFNLRGEPIVNSPKDAYSTFLRSGIDVLVMENFVCEK